MARPSDRAVVVAVAGRLDQESCDRFRLALAPHLSAALGASQGMVLDLSALDYVSSAGLRCFVLAAKEARAQGGRIVAAGLQPMVAEIFRIARFELVLPVYASVDAGIAALGTGG
ncbi:MAG TPA: STAS domain-containing protein [Usitatibacteraceae bacterium]|nr:STAS domain-containing protein [Usitatibacteraceae bacterium]